MTEFGSNILPHTEKSGTSPEYLVGPDYADYSKQLGLSNKEEFIKLRDGSFKVFESRGLIQQATFPSGEKLLVFNTQAFKSGISWTDWKKDVPLSEHVQNKNLLEVMRFLFGGEWGYDLDDYKQVIAGTQLPLKRLFAWPDSAASVKEAGGIDAYMAPYMLSTRGMNTDVLKALDGADISWNEAMLHAKNRNPNPQVGLRRNESIGSFMPDVLVNKLGVEKSLALLAFAEKGYLSFIGDKLHVNLGKFRAIQYRKDNLDTYLRKLAINQDEVVMGNGRNLSYLIDLFSGLEVWANGEQAPLFIIPESDLIDPNNITSLPGHLGLWEVAYGLQKPVAYPTKADGFASNLTLEKMKLITSLWHPKRGDAVRDQSTLRLLVRDPKTRKYEPISSKVMKSWGLRGSPWVEVGLGNQTITHPQPLSNRPGDYLPTIYPELYKSGWLKHGDFRIQKGGATSKYRLVRRELHGRNALVMVNGVQYGLGAEYANQGCYINVLQQGEYAAIAYEKDGQQQILKILHLFQPHEVRQYQRDYPRANLKEYIRGRNRLIDPNIFIQEHPELIYLIDQHQPFIEFSHRLAREFQINLANYPLKEQAMAFRVAAQFGQDGNFWEYVKKNRGKGLKTLMLAVDNLIKPKDLLSVGLLDGSTLLFANIEKILDEVTTREQWAHDELVKAPAVRELTGVEAQAVKYISKAATRLAGNILISTLGADEVQRSRAANALWRVYETVLTLYQQRFELRYEVADFEVLVKLSEMDNSGELVVSEFIDQVVQWVGEMAPNEDREGVEAVLSRAVEFVDHHAELFANSEAFVLGNQRLALRLLARSTMGIEAKKKVLGSMIASRDGGEQLRLLWPMLKDERISDEEKQGLQTLVDILMGAVDDERAVDLQGLYREYDYGSAETHVRGLEQRHDMWWQVLQQHITLDNNTRHRDLGSGLGELVAYFSGKGVTDSRGIEMMAEYVEKAKQQFGDRFEVGDIMKLPDSDEWQNVDMFTLENNVWAHVVGERQKRELFSQLAKRLSPGGVIIGDLGNAKKPGKTQQIVGRCRGHMRRLGVDEALVDKSFISISTPNGRELNVRHFPPEEDMRIMARGAGLDCIAVIEVDWYGDGRDPRLIYLFQKPIEPTP